MLRIKNPLKVKVLPGKTLSVDYKPNGDTPIFDLCDHDGKLLETGILNSNGTRLDIRNLNIGQYYLFILDGAHIFTRKFAI